MVSELSANTNAGATEYFAEPDNAPQRGYDQAAFESAWKEAALGKREAIEEEVKARRAAAPASLNRDWAVARDLIVRWLAGRIV